MEGGRIHSTWVLFYPNVERANGKTGNAVSYNFRRFQIVVMSLKGKTTFKT